MDIFVKSHAEISFPECFTDEDMMACRFFFTWETKPGVNPLSVFLLDGGMDCQLGVTDAVTARKDRKINILVGITVVYISGRMYIADNLGGCRLRHHETAGQDGVVRGVIIDK